MKPCRTTTAVRVSRAAGISQPERVTPSSVVKRTGSYSRPMSAGVAGEPASSGSNGRTSGLTSSREPRTAT